jgi:hypothetical protein
MATQEYWSAVEEKGLRPNEITCAWFLVLAAVVVLQIVTSLAATPFCATQTRTEVAETGVPTPVAVRQQSRVLAAANRPACR